MSVIVVSYNSKAALPECLGSIGSGLSGQTFEVVVVDNASVDGSSELVRTEFPDVRLIRASSNVGFARAVNLAADASFGEYLVLLNPDTVVHPGAITHLLESAQRNPGHVLYGGRTVSPDNTPDFRSCWGLPGVWSLLCFGLGLSTAFRGSRIFDRESLAWLGRDATRTVEGVSGSFLLVQREDWLRLGGFDTRFFMYSEDADLSLRAAQTGIRPLFVADATVTHVGGASSKDRTDKVVLMMAGRVTFIAKHWTPMRRTVGLALLRLGVLQRALLARLLGRRASETQRAWVGVWTQRRHWEQGFDVGQVGP